MALSRKGIKKSVSKKVVKKTSKKAIIKKSNSVKSNKKRMEPINVQNQIC